MRIIFNLRNVGLGNQGGSLTLVKSGNTLVDMGHDVTFVDSFKNKHTWTKLKAKHIRPKNIDNIPDADVVIATGYKSWKHTLNLPKRCGKKYIWLRGWEVWNSSEKNIVSILSDERMIKIVNSICLKKKLETYKIKSYIIKPGNDLNDIYPMQLKEKNHKVILGGLYHTRHKTKRSEWVIQTANALKKKYNNIELHMFGSNKVLTNNVVDKYISQPNIIEKNIFFNNIDIYLAPSELEGLHIVPQEAMMAGCPVVTTNAEMAGTQDYVIHGDTGLTSKNNLKSFINSIEKLYQKPKLRITMGKNARKKIELLGSREENMQKLIEYIMEIKQ